MSIAGSSSHSAAASANQPFSGSSSGMGPWSMLEQGIQDTLGFAVGRRDRDHAEHREDRLLREERAWQEMMMSRGLSMRVKDAKRAGLHPLAALGAQISSPVVSQPQAPLPNYPKFGRTIQAPSPVDEANIRLINKQADFIDEQIADSRLARLTQSVTPEQTVMVEEVPSQRTTHLQTGSKLPWATNPNWVDAEALTKRYGESELLEMALALIIGSADLQYQSRIFRDAKGSGGRDGPAFLYKYVTPPGGK